MSKISRKYLSKFGKTGATASSPRPPASLGIVWRKRANGKQPRLLGVRRSCDSQLCKMALLFGCPGTMPPRSSGQPAIITLAAPSVMQGPRLPASRFTNGANIHYPKHRSSPGRHGHRRAVVNQVRANLGATFLNRYADTASTLSGNGISLQYYPMCSMRPYCLPSSASGPVSPVSVLLTRGRGCFDS